MKAALGFLFVLDAVVAMPLFEPASPGLQH
jgi:hypothetical protein